MRKIVEAVVDEDTMSDDGQEMLKNLRKQGYENYEVRISIKNNRIVMAVLDEDGTKIGSNVVTNIKTLLFYLIGCVGIDTI